MRTMVGSLINQYVTGLRLVDPKDHAGRCVAIDREYEAEVKVLKELTWFYVINRPSLAAQQFGQRRIVRDLHRIYCEATTEKSKRTLLPPTYQDLLQSAEKDAATNQESLEAQIRIATDIVAGLTEDQALALHRRLTGVDVGTVLNPILR